MWPWRRAHSSDPALAGGSVGLELCESCGTARTTGAPPAATAHETAHYAATAGLADRLIEPLRALGERDRMRSTRSLRSGDRVLEIGSGDGRFLAALRDRGMEVAAIEPSPGARERASERSLTTFGEGVEVAEPPGSWQAVIAWHSLEHLEHPDVALQRVRGWLEPEGLLVVAVPNRASLQARIGGDRWFHQDVPRHRTHFTLAGARAIVTRAGFEIEAVRHLVVEQNPLGMWQTLMNRLTSGRDVAYRVIKRGGPGRPGTADLLVTLLAGVVLVPVAIALELIATARRRGGTIVIEARLTKVQGG